MRFVWKTFAALAVASGAAQAQPVPKSDVGSEAQATSAVAKAIPEIDRLFADFQLDAHVPGLVYGIVADGRLVHVKGLGVQDLEAKRPVTADSLFRIASMTKAFTALAILDLRDQGRLSLDAPAETYVPEMRGWRYPTSDSPRIRVRDLLNHTAGFVTDNPWGDRQQPLPEAEFTAMLRGGVPLAHPTGTAYDYSNFGYATLGRIVANVARRPYKDYVERELLQPLGMSATGFEVSEAPSERRALGYRWDNGRWVLEPTMAHGAFGAMGGLQTSANDYAKYVAWLLSAWPARDGADDGPVRRASVRELAHGSMPPQLRTRPGKNGEKACRQAGIYGMGMRVIADCDLGLTLSHSGGYPGYGSYVLLLPDYGIGVFAFANRTYAGATGPVWDAAAALHKASALVPRKLPVSDLLASAYAAAGTMYQAGDVAASKDMLAVNFLLDRSADDWKAEFARLKKDVGTCDTEAPINPTGAMSGRFTWRCATGRLEGEVLLAPTKPATIQSLELKVPAL